MEKNTRKIEPGTPTPDPKYHLEITADGPYLVYGNPPLQQEIFVLNKNKSPEYAKGHKYLTDNEPTVLPLWSVQNPYWTFPSPCRLGSDANRRQ
ncbi:MAG: hypothetical protein ACLU30_01505 [Odoribacter splanchnicus]